MLCFAHFAHFCIGIVLAIHIFVFTNDERSRLAAIHLHLMNFYREEAALIFNIQKCSIHDGTGLRTIVFFKGCPLHCAWCANPESQSYAQEIMEIPRACIACGACTEVCPNSAIAPSESGMLINRELCRKCFHCTSVCYAESKKIAGENMSVDEVFNEVYKDRYFYRQFGGGVTFSGGEPLTQPEFLEALAAKCKRSRINTTLETCGFGSYDEFKGALEYIDAFFIDIKHMDSAIHKKLTGVGNELILDNIKKIASHGSPITIRTPIIPGYNSSEENIAAIADFIKDLPNIREYELLPYHNLGASKYKSLGLEYSLSDVQSPSDENMKMLVKLANRILQPYGKQCFYTKKNEKEIVL